MSVSSVFSRIIAGEFPGTFVWRDEQCVAFMSVNPLTHGHVLVVPIEEVDRWDELPAPLAAHLFAVAHRLAGAIRAAFGSERVGMIIAGFEVPHAHIHLVPVSDMDQMSFANAQPHVERERLEHAAEAIRSHVGDSDLPPSEHHDPSKTTRRI
jgi:histidine triad (HIT) family protein